jgi:hypothetical protein
MSNFALSVNSPYQNVVQSLNYALATLNTSVGTSGNTISGNVLQTSSNGAVYSGIGVISYLNNYVDVAYANTATGSGFSANCKDAQYFGIANTDSDVWDTNPADYTWTQVSGGFGTNKSLFYTTGGGGTIDFFAGTSAPSDLYFSAVDSTPINLQSLANNIVGTDNIQTGAIVGSLIANNAITAINIANNTITSAEIALGGITGTSIAQNTITGNLVALNTITGNLIVPGTITTNLLAANVLVANTIISSNATLEVDTGLGFWFDGNTGNAYMGGNTTIGQNLTVRGLITTSNLIANTVQTTTIIPNGVSTSTFNSTTASQNYSGLSASTPYYFTNQGTSITTTLPNQQILVSASANYIVYSTVSTQYVLQGQLIMYFFNGVAYQYTQLADLTCTPILNPQSSSSGNYYYDGSLQITASTIVPVSGVNVGNTYTFYIALETGPGTPPSSIQFHDGTVLIQNLYR